MEFSSLLLAMVLDGTLAVAASRGSLLFIPGGVLPTPYPENAVTGYVEFQRAVLTPVTRKAPLLAPAPLADREVEQQIVVKPTPEKREKKLRKKPAVQAPPPDSQRLQHRFVEAQRSKPDGTTVITPPRPRRPRTGADSSHFGFHGI